MLGIAAMLFTLWIQAHGVLSFAASGDPVPYTTSGNEQHVINWVCTGNPTDSKGRSVDIPEVCSNMCYGIFCRGFDSSLYYDKYKDATVKKSIRAAHAGCGNANRCSKGSFAGRNYQCDEYPFGSISQSDSNNPLPINRCVPAFQNSKQGSGLQAMYQSTGPFTSTGLGGNKGTFRNAFANSGDLPYCKNAPNPDCTNDGNEYDLNGLAMTMKKRDSASIFAPLTSMTTYALSNGMYIHMAGDLAPFNTTVYTPKYHDYELMIDMLENHIYDSEERESQYDYMLFNIYFDTEFIIGVVDDSI